MAENDENRSGAPRKRVRGSAAKRQAAGPARPSAGGARSKRPTRRSDDASVVRMDAIAAAIVICDPSGVITDLNDQVKRNDLRLESRKKYYEAKFLAMEQAMSKYQSLGNSLASSIQGFINSSSSKK